MNWHDLPSPEEVEERFKKALVDPAIVRGVMTRIPPVWTLLTSNDMGAYFRLGRLQAAVSVQKYDDLKIWLHVSCCKKNPWQLPRWKELKRVKVDFIGVDRWAYQVFPSDKDYVNQNPYVLHMFSLLEGEPALPDFTMGLRSL